MERAVAVTTGRPLFVHIGAPKTGTTYLQTLMAVSRDPLADAGLCVPGPEGNHQPATREFRRSRADSPATRRGPASWRALVTQVNAWDGPAVVSNETFGARLTSYHREQLRQQFPDHTLHVVITVRDLQRQLPAAWQEAVKNGSTLGFADYVRLIRGRPGRDHADERRLWAAQDAVEVLGRWSDTVPDERVHVVTVPQPGAPRDVLWQRFAQVVGVDPKAVREVTTRPNVSLGAVETNVLRRLNEYLATAADPLTDKQYLDWVKWPVGNGALQSPGERTPIDLTADQARWVSSASAELADRLQASPYRIVGDLNELRPQAKDAGPAYRDPDLSDPDAERDVAIATLAELARRAGRRAKSNDGPSRPDS